MNIAKYLIEKGYAHAQRHAEHYIAKIELDELYNSGGSDEEIIARIELYEAWKKYMPDKDEREHCAQMAISGVPVPTTEIPMFPEQNPFGELDEAVVEESANRLDGELEDCKHGIPRMFCSECAPAVILNPKVAEK